MTTLAEIAKRMNKSERTVMRMMERRKFPRHQKRYGRMLTWDRRKVDAWFRDDRKKKGPKK